MSDIVVGLDIGTLFIRAAIGEIDEEGNVEIIGLAKNNSQGLRNGAIVNIEAAMNAIRETISQAELNAGYEVTSCITGIGGSQIGSKNSRGQVAVGKNGKNNREITESDIERAIEAAKAVQIPMDREMLHVVPQNYIVDGNGGIKNPRDMMGVRLEVEVHIVTASKTSIQNITSCINRAGYELDQVMLKTLAATEAVVHDDELDMGSILIDLGAGTTDVLVLIGGAPVCSFSIPVGGNLVTNDIAIVKGISTSVSERIKVDYGCCFLPLLDESKEVIIPGVGGRPPESTDQREFCEIIQSRMEEIFLMVKKGIVNQTDLTRLSGNIILTGGGAQMEGVVELAQQVFGTTAVRLGIPEKLGGVEAEYRKPEFVTVIGLVLSMRNSRKFAGKSQKKHGQTGKKENIFKKLKDMFF